jgi:hypothetical protein
MTPAVGVRRRRETHRNLRTAVARERQASQDKLNADLMAAESAGLAQEARVGFEAELISLDPRRKRRSSLPWAVLAVILVAAIDGLPAFWAAEALGHGIWPTSIVAAILVAALAGFAVLMTTFNHDGKRQLFWTAAVLALAMIGVQSGLRLEFLVVTSNAGWLAAGLEAALLAGITLSLVWVGYVILDRAESAEMCRQRRAVLKLERNAKRQADAAEEAGNRLLAAEEALAHVERHGGGRGQHWDLDDDLLKVATAKAEDAPPGVDPIASGAV